MRIRLPRRTSQKLMLFGYAFLAAGVAILVASQVLPLFEAPQSFNVKGPSKELGATRTYWIDTYFTPKVVGGSPLEISFTLGGQGYIYAYVYTSSDLFHTDSQGGQPPLGDIALNSTEGSASVNLTAPKTDVYVVSVVAYNSTYTMEVSSVWPPFYWASYYVPHGLIAAALGVTLLFYGREERKWEMNAYGLPGLK